VWHCHILSHEEHDMMRPLIVLPASSTAAPVRTVSVFSATPVVNASWNDFTDRVTTLRSETDSVLVAQQDPLDLN
jgi:hypothetical protein